MPLAAPAGSGEINTINNVKSMSHTGVLQVVIFAMVSS
jgi:FtsP/CotA-like multicopper oxidase with cupredoxin domain